MCAVNELHLIGLDGPNHHLLIELHVIEGSQDARTRRLLDIERNSEQIGAEWDTDLGLQVALDVLQLFNVVDLGSLFISLQAGKLCIKLLATLYLLDSNSFRLFFILVLVKRVLFPR